MQSARFSVFAIALLAGASIAGCSASSNVNQLAVAGTASLPGGAGFGGAESGGTPSYASNSGGAGELLPDSTLDVSPDTAGSPGVGGSTSEPYPDTLPDGFVAANMFGGYRVGAEITAAVGSSSELPNIDKDGCGTTILAVIRDFQADGKNFEGPDSVDDRNVVLPELGADRKP